MTDIEKAYRLGFLDAANLLSIWKDGSRTVGVMERPYWKVVLESKDWEDDFFDPPINVSEIDGRLGAIDAEAENSKTWAEKE